MRIPSFCLLLAGSILVASSLFAQSTPCDSVDPLIGTSGGGNTFPGATLPFGMIQWSPDTNQDAWYKHDEKQLYGFSLTHISGAGCPLYGDFAVLPTLDALTASPGTKFTPAPFDRKDEQAHPGYYAVTLNNGVRVELTVAERAGIARFTFPQGTAMRMLINAGSSANSIPAPNENPKDHEAFGNHIEVKADGSFSGWTSAGRFCGSDSHYKLYVAGKLSKPFQSTTLWQDGGFLKDAKSATGKHTGASMPKRDANAGPGADQLGFEEGNTWQYSFMVPHDYPALFAAMGGDQVVETRLDKFFTALRCWGKPCFNIENEPDFVTPYAYVFLGKPWKTQDVVTRIAAQTFKAAPDGIPGNDDLGATSGVYVWNALALYPAVPGVGALAMGTPMFDKATLKLAGDRTVVISREGPGIYVQRVTMNDTPYSSTWLPIDKIHSGTTQLHFVMGSVPNKELGTAQQDRPPDFR